MTIQEKLNLIKELTGKTQESLACELDVSFPTLNSWINGKSEPRGGNVKVINAMLASIIGVGKSDTELSSILPKSVRDAKELVLKARRALYGDVLGTIMGRKDIYDEFVLLLTYNSNAIEGSTFTQDDTHDVLFDGVTLCNKSVVEHVEVKNHQAALRYMFDHVESGAEIDEEFVLRLHEILMNGILDNAGKYRGHSVRIVGSYVPTANYVKVPQLVKELLNFGACDRLSVQDVARIHSEFEKVHPFSDGNGRVGRLIADAMLLKTNMPPAVVLQSKRREYYKALSTAQIKCDFSLIEEFFVMAVIGGYKILD